MKRRVETFNLGGATAETLTFGAGPYLRVDVEGASLELTGLGTLSGDFAFEQSGDVTKVGVSNVTASVDVRGSAGSLGARKGSDVSDRSWSSRNA